MEKNNDIEYKDRSKRKVLSLRDNKGSQTADTNNSERIVGRVKVEYKRKRSGLKRRQNVNSVLSQSTVRNVGTAKLTDDEFKERIKALQNSMPGTDRLTAGSVSQNALEKKQSINNNKNETTADILNKESPSVNTLNTLNSASKTQESGLIDRLIKMAPKNNKRDSNEPIKPVVFRSEAFAKKKKISEPSRRENRNVINKAENQSRNTDQRGVGKARIIARSNNDNNVGVSQRGRKSAKPVLTNKNITNSSRMPQSEEHRKGYNFPTPASVSKSKNAKPIKKYKPVKDERTSNYIKKVDNGKFSKRDLVLAMNDDNAVRSRSVASIKRAKQKFKNGSSTAGNTVIREVRIPDSITVGELAKQMAIKASEIVKYLMSVGSLATINQIIDGDTAEIICTSFGHIAKRVSDSDFEQELDYSILDTAENLQSRAPIVAVMGHVDHGKTTLLDTLRNTSVTQKEVGGITQRVAAYQVKAPSGKEITFIDTPGHAAFANIRTRGAKLTDIIVLVVAADDGIKDQTIEIIKEAHAQNVPLVIAINKIDKPDIDINKVKNALMQYDVLLEEFGGDVLCVEISAKNNINLDKLLDTILLQAEVLDLKANASRKANCTIVESKMEKGRGIVASVIVEGGTLNIGDVFVSGATCGKVRSITDSCGTRINTCEPSMPVEIVGFDNVPEPGDTLIVVDSEKKAREIASKRREMQARKNAKKLSVKGIKEIMEDNEKPVQTLNVYVKADVYGSLEAIETSLLAIESSKIKIAIVGMSVGAVTEGDISLAKSSGSVIVCFNTSIVPSARRVAEEVGVKIISNDVIYHLTNSVIEIMENLLPPIIEEAYIGKMLVKKLFFISKLGTVAGGVVVDGFIRRNDSKIRVIRNGKKIYEGAIKSMKHEKDEIKECGVNRECGILMDNFNDCEEGDYVECYALIERRQKLQ